MSLVSSIWPPGMYLRTTRLVFLGSPDKSIGYANNLRIRALSGRIGGTETESVLLLSFHASTVESEVGQAETGTETTRDK